MDFDPVRAKAEGRPTGLPPEISDLFPDELVDSEIGEIPKGWSISSIGEHADVTEAVIAELDKLAAAQDRLDMIEKYFNG